jgi:hypothetical protein
MKELSARATQLPLPVMDHMYQYSPGDFKSLDQTTVSPGRIPDCNLDGAPCVNGRLVKGENSLVWINLPITCFSCERSLHFE